MRAVVLISCLLPGSFGMRGGRGGGTGGPTPGTCDISGVVQGAQDVSTACCTAGECQGEVGLPRTCSEECAPVFLDFWDLHGVNCQSFLDTLPGMSGVFDTFHASCENPVTTGSGADPDCTITAVMPTLATCAMASPRDPAFCGGPCYQVLQPLMTACGDELGEPTIQMLVGSAMSLVNECAADAHGQGAAAGLSWADRDHTCHVEELLTACSAGMGTPDPNDPMAVCIAARVHSAAHFYLPSW